MAPDIESLRGILRSSKGATAGNPDRSSPRSNTEIASATMRVMTLPANLFADLPGRLPEELFTTLLASDSLRIERIVSFGHASPEGFWFDQQQHEWVVLLQGAARLRLEDGEVELAPGSFLNIPAHRRHRVEWTTPDEPTVWLAIYYGDETP